MNLNIKKNLYNYIIGTLLFITLVGGITGEINKYAACLISGYCLFAMSLGFFIKAIMTTSLKTLNKIESFTYIFILIMCIGLTLFMAYILYILTEVLVFE